MQFELWSIWHFLYMISPFALFFPLYFFIRKRPEKAKYLLGAILGGISVFILVLRNVDIFIREGWGVEVIPLQVCHIGSLVAGIALLTKKKWLLLTSFCFHLIPAFLAMVFADSLVNYDTLFKIRPQTYIWGHIFIVICALYGILVFLPKFTKKDLIHSLIFVGILSLLAIVCNSALRALFAWEANYFYLYNYKGTPLKFLYEALPTSTYGWFSINWFYTLTLFAVFIAAFIALFFISNLLIKKVKAN